LRLRHFICGLAAGIAANAGVAEAAVKSGSLTVTATIAPICTVSYGSAPYQVARLTIACTGPIPYRQSDSREQQPSVSEAGWLPAAAPSDSRLPAQDGDETGLNAAGMHASVRIVTVIF
jgi:hypothetical protein